MIRIPGATVLQSSIHEASTYLMCPAAEGDVWPTQIGAGLNHG